MLGDGAGEIRGGGNREAACFVVRRLGRLLARLQPLFRRPAAAAFLQGARRNEHWNDDVDQHSPGA